MIMKIKKCWATTLISTFERFLLILIKKKSSNVDFDSSNSSDSFPKENLLSKIRFIFLIFIVINLIVGFLTEGGNLLEITFSVTNCGLMTMRSIFTLTNETCLSSTNRVEDAELSLMRNLFLSNSATTFI